MEMAKSSREYACVRIQAYIGYLYKYFELAFDFLEAILHILEDSRTYFCCLSEYDQICFVTECFHPFVSGQKFLENPFDNLENCILNKEEADLVFIAYLLLYKKKMHFSKIFQCFEVYGATASISDLGASEEITYFQERKKYFCIRSDGFVALNHISELSTLKSPSFSNCFNMYSKINCSKHISLFRKNQNQPTAHDVHDFILTQCSHTQSKARDNNSKPESANDVFLGDKTAKSDIVNNFDAVNCIQNNYTSENVCKTNLVLNKILSSHIFLSEFLQESAFNFDRLKIILHVFEKQRKYFCNLSFTEQNRFIKQICKYFHPKSASCLDNNLNSRRICKLSEKRKVLLHITHLLYPDKKIHFSELLQKINIFYNLIDCLSTFNMQLAFFEKTKKYFTIESDGFVEINLAPDLKVLNTEIFNDCISVNPGISSSLAPLEQEVENAVKLNDDYATLKTCTKPSNIPQSITEGEGSFNEHFETHKTAEEIITSPSSELDRIFKLLARKAENIQNKDDITISFILRDSPNTYNLSKQGSGQANEVYTVSDSNIDISKNNWKVMEEKSEIMIGKMNFDSSKQNSHSMNEVDIPTNKQDDNSCSRRKMEIPLNDEIISFTDSVKELEPNIQDETLGTSEDLTCNSLKDESVNYSLTDKTVNDCVTQKKEEKTDFWTVLNNKTALCDNITDKSVTSVAISATEPNEIVQNCPGENYHFKSNITKVPDSYSITSNNVENFQEALKAIKIDTANEAKNIICSSNITNNGIKTPEDALPNISSATEMDFHNEYNLKTSDISPPVNEKKISNLQRVPKQSPKLGKYPTQESQLPISTERTYTYLNPSAFFLSDRSEDHDFGLIKPHPFDNTAYNDYCTKIVDSILGPLNFPTSNRLECEELKSHDVSLCLKELVKLEKYSNFRLNVSEEDRYFVKNCFQTSKVCKHSETERRVVNFFIVILGKYCSGLSLKMLHTYLQIASKEVVQYLNDCYEDNLLHFFRANENYFYVSPISRNIYLRK
ncbi:hypothetical protein X975_20821, partial [Stegodyphus mimosarum]